jgi:arsenate reductase
MLQILHNPRCGKSRNCLTFYTEKNISFQIINYLDHPLSEEFLGNLVKKLNINPIDLVRQKETIWKENYKNKSLSDQQIINTLVKHPILIERPIVIKGDEAIIGREIEKLKTFI